MDDKSNLFRDQLYKLLNRSLLPSNQDLIQRIEVDIFLRDGIYMVGIDIWFLKNGNENNLRERLDNSIHKYLQTTCSMIIPFNYSVGWAKYFIE